MSSVTASDNLSVSLQDKNFTLSEGHIFSIFIFNFLQIPILGADHVGRREHLDVERHNDDNRPHHVHPLRPEHPHPALHAPRLPRHRQLGRAGLGQDDADAATDGQVLGQPAS